ncbi:hypothetical protein [Rhabdothermincola salaria]|uniref:hypothetical protein n=1 Tax=Rhabdothermincola salaria TaxID=2903142 RepID=UPI001E62F32F|nr:hypothetical protein [Rhabdothermincola salaria]MCD9625257.1 hypothetical protein [Rhabdothermincola salaria]
MHDPHTTPTDRVRRARELAVSAATLDVQTRLLLAAAEAADATVTTELRARVACAIADKAQHDIAAASSVREMHTAVCDALASDDLAGIVPGGAVVRLVWRLVFDLWGGPER